MEKVTKAEKKNTDMGEVKTNPLTNERIFVRFIPHEGGFAGNNKNHVLFGGLADGAQITLCAPVLRTTGKYKNVLTNDEKDFLEKALGLDNNALSVYNTKDNYWDDFKITLTKDGLHLNLSDPEDYIRYKVLLAHSDIIAPSVQERIDRFKNTYRFELVRESEDADIEGLRIDATKASWKEYGKIEDDYDTMRVLVELLDGRPYSTNEKLSYFKLRASKAIESDPKTFLNTVTDPLFHAKVLIKRGKELGKVMQRGDYYYLASDKSPLCESNEDPTLSVAAKYINSPSHQDIKFILESEVDKNRI